MPDEKRVYRDAITNLLDAMKERLGPKVRDRLRTEAGVDERALVPAYTIEAHDRMIKVLAEELFPAPSLDVSTYELGRANIAHYGRGVLGRALFSLIRLIGPMRMLKRVPQYYRQTNNYADVKVEVVGPTSYVLDHNEVGAWPHYMRGSMQGSGEVIGLAGHAVELVAYDGHAAKFRVSWS